MNDAVKPGDRIMLLHMDGEMRPRMGSEGTVHSITQDPFEDDNLIISVNWDEGSTLSILSKYDVYKITQKAINEARGDDMNLLIKNTDIIKSYDLKWFKEYLDLVRETGITNMFGASFTLFAGKDHIDRYYGEGKEDDETFQELLDMSEEAKYKMINGTMKFLEMIGKDQYDVSLIERYLKANASKILSIWMSYLH